MFNNMDSVLKRFKTLYCFGDLKQQPFTINSKKLSDTLSCSVNVLFLYIAFVALLFVLNLSVFSRSKYYAHISRGKYVLTVIY